MRQRTQKNKRVKASMKYKVKKNAAEHRRRIRKESKKAKINKVTPRSVTNAGHIPNMFPHKKQIIEHHDKQKEIEKLIKKENKKIKRKNKNQEEMPEVEEESQ